MIQLRKTTVEDIPEILSIYEDSRRFMAENGNPTQWSSHYPSREHVQKDIDTGAGYVLVDEEGILATFHLSYDCDPYYAIILGNWHSNSPYAVIHRLAVADRAKGQGLSTQCLQAAEKMSLEAGREWLRIDTHLNNVPMTNIIYKNDFKYCGTIRITESEKRIAFDKYIGK